MQTLEYCSKHLTVTVGLKNAWREHLQSKYNLATEMERQTATETSEQYSHRSVNMTRPKNIKRKHSLSV